MFCQVSRATARTVSIYASPLRLRKIRSTLNFSNLVGISRSNYHSLVSLHGGEDTSTHTRQSLSSIKSGEDEYVKGIRRILDSSIRDPRTREVTVAKCSGLASGELSCKLCKWDNNLTASQGGIQSMTSSTKIILISKSLWHKKFFCQNLYSLEKVIWTFFYFQCLP